MPIRVFDRYGHEQSWDWLVAEYGPIVVHPADPGPGWRLVEVWENADPLQVGEKFTTGPFAGHLHAPAVIVVKLLLPDGSPAVGLKIAWYWPDAPEDPRCGPSNGVPAGMIPGRAVYGVTDSNGVTGFAMGDGAFYWPDRGEIGPHATWPYGEGTNTDLMLGLGMRAATNHDSLWPVFQWFEEEEPPPPPPPPPPPELPVDEIAAQIGAMIAGLEQLDALIGAFAKALGAIQRLLVAPARDREDGA